MDYAYIEIVCKRKFDLFINHLENQRPK